MRQAWMGAFESVWAAGDEFEAHLRSNLRLGTSTLCGQEVASAATHEEAPTAAEAVHCKDCIKTAEHFQVIAAP